MRQVKDLPNLHGFEFMGYTKNLNRLRGIVLFDGKIYKTFAKHQSGAIYPLGALNLMGWDYLPEL